MKMLPSLLSLCALAAPARAELVGVQLGTDAPPDGLGWTWFAPSPFDDRLFSDVTFALDDFGRPITFSSPVSVRQIGQGWVTWSHGYTGNVYYSNGVTSLTVGFSNTAAYLYAEPNPFGVFNITATGSDGVASVRFSEGVDGYGGAKGWAFYGHGGDVSVTLSSDVDFAVGEFGVGWVPSPGGPALIGLAALRPARRRSPT